mgnify:CR=1 FL=1
MKDYLSLEDIAEKLNVSTISLRRYVKSGRLKARRIGRAYKVTTDEAEAFIQSFESGESWKWCYVDEIMAE